MTALPSPRRRAATSAAQHGPESCVFAFAAEGDSGRDDLERFVAQNYARAYGARVRRFQPHLLGLRRGDWVVGTVGARDAGAAPRLYLETYLDAPVEHVLAAVTAQPVARRDLVEVGNLAGAAPGSGRALLGLLASWLVARQIPWAVFTATGPLRNTFLRMRVPLVDLGAADGARVGEELPSWGAYYDTEPRVSAARVADVLRAATDDVRLQDLYGRAFASAADHGRAFGGAAR
jgi:hypothetical protein